MGGGDKGGGSDQSGMYMAMASVEAANKAYSLGQQQLQWTKDVWNAEQPLMEASEKANMDLSGKQAAALDQMTAETKQQWDQYQQLYAPLEASYVGQVENWASPEQIALQRGQAMGDVAEQGQKGLNTAAETLRSYGINPGSARYASLYTGAQPMIGAAQAAAGTTAEQNAKLQQMGLESGAINTGRGLVNATQGLSSAGTGAANSASGAASGAASTAQNNLTSGSNAMTNPSSWFNAGSNAMGVYTNAVNGYNQSEASQSGGGWGSLAGTVGGLLTKALPASFLAAGGTVDTYQDTPTQGGGATGIPSAPMMPRQTYAQGGDTMGADASATPGGGIPAHASPSMGVATDDVPAMLTAHEFVIPKDVAIWKGHEYFAKEIDKARQGHEQFRGRNDIGGTPVHAIPQHPTFVSRPAHAMGGAIPGMPG